jgi:hypothetical protein
MQSSKFARVAAATSSTCNTSRHGLLDKDSPRPKRLPPLQTMATTGVGHTPACKGPTSSQEARRLIHKLSFCYQRSPAPHATAAPTVVRSLSSSPTRGGCLQSLQRPRQHNARKPLRMSVLCMLSGPCGALDAAIVDAQVYCMLFPFQTFTMCNTLQIACHLAQRPTRRTHLTLIYLGVNRHGMERLASHSGFAAAGGFGRRL